MNYRDHMTHWNGISLKSMTQKELIKVCQQLHEQLDIYRQESINRNQPKNERMEWPDKDHFTF